MKKNFFILLLLLILLGIVAYNIPLLRKNINENVLKTNETSSSDVTIVDVTNLATGDEASHICENFFKTKYDENSHWKECTVCKNKYNIANHSYTTTGTYGCSTAIGYQYNSCSCGYSYRLEKKQHTVSQIKPYPDSLVHYSTCTVCGEAFSNKKEWQIEIITGATSGLCHTSDGKIIGCGNSGTCSLCGRYASANKHNIFQRIDKETNISINGNTTIETYNLGCTTCGFKIGTAKITRIKTGTNTYNYTFQYTITDNNYVQNEKGRLDNSSYINQISISNISKSQNGNTYTLSATITSKNTLPPGFYTQPFLWCDGYYKGEYIGLQVWSTKNGTALVSDTVSPVLSSTPEVSYPNYSDGFANKAILTAKYTENYPNSLCYIRVLDSDMETVIYDWTAGTKSGTSFSASFDITDETIENKVLYVQAKDLCENITDFTSVTIEKLDSKSPEIIIKNSINAEWQKSKDLLVEARDYGIGEVSLAFNNVQNYELANFTDDTYQKQYRLVGDVYTDTLVAIYAKDLLGNTSTEFITINNIDNTSPTIVSASIHNNILSVNSNDVKTDLGEGSGVVKYRYITSDEKLDNPNVSSGIEVGVSDNFIISDIVNVKFVYIVAEDLVRQYK